MGLVTGLRARSAVAHVTEEVEGLKDPEGHVTFRQGDLGRIKPTDRPVHERLTIADGRVVDHHERDLDGAGGHGTPADRWRDVRPVTGVPGVELASGQPRCRQSERLDDGLGIAVRAAGALAVRLDSHFAREGARRVDAELVVDRRRHGLAGIVGGIEGLELFAVAGVAADEPSESDEHCDHRNPRRDDPSMHALDRRRCRTPGGITTEIGHR